MVRPLTLFEGTAEQVATATARGRIDRSTARALAAAISSLAVATIVVSQSAKGLQVEGTAATNDFEAGTITLADDDGGRSLVELENMAPGRPVERCITVTYTGTVLPVEVSLAAVTSGDVAPYVDIDIEHGRGGRFGDCSAFEPETVVFEGSLGDLEEGVLDLGVFRSQGEDMSLRFTFDLLDEIDAAGRRGAVDFMWEAVPG